MTTIAIDTASVDINPAKRRAEATIFTGTEKTNRYNETFKAAITFSVSHDKDYKAFLIFLDREAQSPTVHTRIVDFGADAPDLVRNFRYRVPVARFSEKALRSAFEQALGDFEKALAADLTVADALITWTDKILDRE